MRGFISSMSRFDNVRDRFGIKLHGWNYYLLAVEAQLDPNGDGNPDRIEAEKRHLLSALERLEMEANGPPALASAVRMRIRRASNLLKKALDGARPESLANYVKQRREIAKSIAE